MSKPATVKIEMVRDGEPFIAASKNYLETCCDCGLTHRIKYEAIDKDGKVIKGARTKVTVWRRKALSKEVRGRGRYTHKEL